MTQQEILLIILALSAFLLQYRFVQATGANVVTHQSISIQQSQQQAERTLQSEGEDPCSDNHTISGFSAYDAGSNTSNYIFYWPFVFGYPQSVISLEEYSSKKLNIIANTCADIPPIGCLKMSLGDFKTSYEKSAPYTLYGDSQKDGTVYVSKPRKTGWQTLQAWTYSTSECSGNSTGYKRIELLIVPKATGTIAIAPVVAVYQGTTHPATRAETKAVVNSTCEFIHSAFENTNPDVIIVTKFKCFDVPVDTTNSTAPTQPLTIVYKIFVTFHLHLNIISIADIGLSALPTRDTVMKLIKDLFTDVVGIYPGSIDPVYNQNMSTFVKTRIGASSPYFRYMNIAVS